MKKYNKINKLNIDNFYFLSVFMFYKQEGGKSPPGRDFKFYI